MAPRTLGPFELLRPIASGGMAEVWLARKHGPGGFEQLVALKCVLPHLARDEGFVAMFRDEARLAAALRHPAIVAVLDFGFDDGAWWLALEYVRGVSLRTLLDQARRTGRRVPQALAAWIVASVAEALDYAHERAEDRGRPARVVHRDVSPSNVLLSFEGEVKLADFGIARAAQTGERTRTGVVKGKAAYMSPEQTRGASLDGRSDLFALGAVLFEALTLRRLFDAEDELAALAQVREMEIPPVASVADSISPELDAIARRALARDPNDRFSRGGELADALRLHLGAAGALVDARSLGRELRDRFPDEASSAAVPEPTTRVLPAVDATRPSAAKPVAAHPPAGVREMRTWHRPLVAGAAAVLVVSIAATLVGRRRATHLEGAPITPGPTFERTETLAAEPIRASAAPAAARPMQAASAPATAAVAPASPTRPPPEGPSATPAFGPATPRTEGSIRVGDGPGTLVVTVGTRGATLFFGGAVIPVPGVSVTLAGVPEGRHLVRAEHPAWSRPARRTIEVTSADRRVEVAFASDAP